MSKKQNQEKRSPKDYKDPNRGKAHDPDLPVLQRDQGFDFSIKYIEWRKAMAMKCRRLFGRLADMFVSLEEPSIPEVEIDTSLNDTSDPGGYRRYEIREQVKSRRAMIERMRADRPQMYAVIWQQISIASEKAVMADAVQRYQDNWHAEYEKYLQQLAEYEDFVRRNANGNSLNNVSSSSAAVAASSMSAPSGPPVVPTPPEPLGTSTEIWNDFELFADPLHLLQSIHRTHVAHTTVFSEGDKIRAREAYATLRQRAYETVADFRSRTEATLSALEAVREILPSEETVAQDFVHRLHSRYNAFKAHVINNATLNVSVFPKTLQSACDLATAFMVVQSTDGDRNNFGAVMHLGASPKEKKKSPTRPCRICGGAHYDNKCPMIDKAKQLAESESRRVESKDDGADDKDVAHVRDKRPKKKDKTIFEGVHAIVATATTQSRNIVAFDTCSTIHLFGTKELLCDIKQNVDGIKVAGVDKHGKPFTPRFTGIFKPVGRVYYDPRVKLNILSGAQLAKDYEVWKHPDDDEYHVQCGEHKFTFAPMDDLYVCDLKGSHHPLVLVNTTKDLEARYTKREVEQAREAMSLMRKLDCPSAGELKSALNKGLILNCPVIAADIDRAIEIYGPPKQSIFGKMTRPRPQVMSTEDTRSPPDELRQQRLHVDIMALNSQMFLVSVAMPLGMTTIQYIPNKSASAVLNAIKDQLTKIRAKQFEVKEIMSDGENTLSALAGAYEELRAAHVRVPPGTHNPIVERKIREIKERVRGMLKALPYKLPAILLKYLVYRAVISINIMPTRSAHVDASAASPREKFFGRKIDFAKDLTCEFGEFVVCYDPHIPAINSMTSRGQEAIALYPTLDGTGSAVLFNIATRRVVTRNKFVTIPLTPECIERIENLDKTIEVPIDEDAIPQATETPQVTETSQADQETTIPHEVDQDAAIASDNIVHIRDNDNAAAAASDNIVHIRDNAEVAQDTNADKGEIEEPVPLTERTHRYPLRSPALRQIPKRLVSALMQSANIFKTTVVNKSRDPSLVKAAVLKEAKNLVTHRTFMPVRPRNYNDVDQSNLLNTFNFVRDKYRPDGTIEKVKSRTAILGNKDQFVYSRSDKSSPTVSAIAERCVFAIAAHEGRQIRKFDIGSAFNEAIMVSKDPIIVQVDKVTTEAICNVEDKYRPFVNKRGTMIAKLNKALYGHVQSALMWYKTLKNFLESNGYSVNAYDKCVFNKTTGSVQVTVTFHVDDIIATCVNPNLIDELQRQLKARFKDVTVQEGPFFEHLGAVIDARDSRRLKFSMQAYTQDIVDTMGVTATVATPAGPDLFEIDAKSPLLSPEAKERYHTIVGKCIYLTQKTRPDIMLTVNWLATRVSQPTRQDEDKLTRLIKYLNKTQELCLYVSASSLQVIGQFDASYAVHKDGKSHSGGRIVVGETTVQAHSSKQSLVTKSSTEAEQVSASDQSSDAIFVRNFMQEQGYEMKPAIIHQDNQSTITMIRNGKSNGRRNRHIDVRYFFLKDREERGEIKIEYLSTINMVADTLTKPLQGKLFYKHQAALLNLPQDGDWADGGVLEELQETKATDLEKARNPRSVKYE